MRRFSFLTIALLLAAATTARGDQRTLTLGSSGELYRVVTGTYGELFSGQTGDEPVLAVEILRRGEPAERLLVPGTEGSEVESSASVVYEEGPGTLFVIWESRTNRIHSQIKLASFGQEGWSEPLDLPGEFFSLKTSPDLAVTRDTFLTYDEDGNRQAHDRTIYHVIWWEEAAAGERVVYSPVTLIDGSYIGWSPLFSLSDLGYGWASGGGLLPTPELGRSPRIRAGQNRRSAVAGLVDPQTRQLVELEIEAVTGELALLAREIQTGLLAAGEEVYRDHRPTLADRARVQIIEFGHRLSLHPGLLQYLADLLAEVVAADEGQGLAALADRARVQIIEFGARMAAQGLTPSPGEEISWVLEFPGQETPPRQAEPLHALSVRLAAARPVPEIGSGPTTLFLSRDGKEALVAWQQGEVLYFRETNGIDWSEVHSLELGPDLDLAQAQAVLEQRISSR